MFPRFSFSPANMAVKEPSSLFATPVKKLDLQSLFSNKTLSPLRKLVTNEKLVGVTDTFTGELLGAAVSENISECVVGSRISKFWVADRI